jgi:lipopolysaccharide export LptBFGC system permease protein LptF
MVAELDSIADPAERTRFALGAIAAVVRLALSGYGRSTVHAPGRLLGFGESDDDASSGGPSMRNLTTRQLLGRLVAPFIISFASLTVLLLANSAARLLPGLSARGVPARGIADALIFSVPHTAALTIPMAVFLAVSWAFMRLGKEGILASARRERRGIRSLVTPVVAAAAVMAALTFVSNSEVVPRANAQLGALIRGAPIGANDRTMTIGELRKAAGTARSESRSDAAARAAAYEVEIQKKVALAVASIFLALVGATIAIRFPRGGARLVLVAAGAVFTGYYFVLVAGESLADRQMLSPLVAMWMANGALLVLALLLAWRPSRPHRTNGTGTLAIDGS